MKRRRRLFLVVLAVTFTLWVIFTWYGHRKNHTSKRNYFSLDESDVAVKLRSNGDQSEYIDKRGMHVVVGKYVGDALQKEVPTLTAEELNKNGYHPEDNAGENGQPVFLSGNNKRIAKRLWHINKFNLVASDMISINRTVPDVRKTACKERSYDTASLANTSVIIVFHNEAWSTLLRTVVSVISRSPASLLEEIILVDDASNRTYLGSSLDAYVASLPVSVRVVRTPVRIGLIKARLRGAEKATGSVLVFLDAHCEVTAGWLEPLLARIAEKSTAVVCPVIDIINDDNFSYVKSFSLHWGAFNWELHFRWFTMGKSVMDNFVATGGTDPFKTPAMAGGLFAINREYFYKMGSYDEAMDIWGGENLEMSFRIWMCGGSVEIAPCSHVGHVFRKASPYTFPREGGVNHVLHTNLARVASVWLDEYADFYFKLNPRAKQEAQFQDVSARRQLRTDLQCKNFQWYLDNVWPENFLPSRQRFFGKMKHVASGTCLQRPAIPMTAASTQSNRGQAGLSHCVEKFHIYQQLVLEDGRVGAVMTDEAMCLDVPNYQDANEASVRFMACNQLDRQMWRFDPSIDRLVHNATDQCLSHVTEGTSDQLVLKPCAKSKGDPSQQFQLISEEWREK